MAEIVITNFNPIMGSLILVFLNEPHVVYVPIVALKAWTIFVFPIISQHWDGVDSWDPSLLKQEPQLSCILQMEYSGFNSRALIQYKDVILPV